MQHLELPTDAMMVQVMGLTERSAFLCIHIEEVLESSRSPPFPRTKARHLANSSCGILNVSATVVTNSRSSSLASRSAWTNSISERGRCTADGA